MNDANPTAWGYYKLYFGQQAARADDFVVDLTRRMAANPSLQMWFYLRYLDEAGFHLRLRFLPRPGDAERAQQSVHKECADMLDRMYEYLPTTYQPMVTLPDFGAIAPPVADPRLRIVADEYVPEHEKYGTAAAMRIAEGVFQLSSELAGRIIDDEASGSYSRKSVAPWLMYEPTRAFPASAHPDYWRQYGLYWLGGDSAAANDWRARFARKAEELHAAGHAVLAGEAQLPAAALAVVARWRQGLSEAAHAYAALKDGSNARPDVLSLNFAHLMMNRLGIATLEEAYLAALLEAELGRAEREALA